MCKETSCACVQYVQLHDFDIVYHDPVVRA
jgi:hypothetical protein